MKTYRVELINCVTVEVDAETPTEAASLAQSDNLNYKVDSVYDNETDEELYQCEGCSEYFLMEDGCAMTDDGDFCKGCSKAMNDDYLAWFNPFKDQITAMGYTVRDDDGLDEINEQYGYLSPAETVEFAIKNNLLINI